MKMKKTLLIMFISLSLATGISQAKGLVSIDLEPTTNGAVSASGLFPSQELENRYGTFDALDVEPSLNGAVSASGLYPTQEMEDAAANKI